MQRLIKHGFPIHTAASKWNRDKCHEVSTKHACMHAFTAKRYLINHRACDQQMSKLNVRPILRMFLGFSVFFAWSISRTAFFFSVQWFDVVVDGFQVGESIEDWTCVTSSYRPLSNTNVSFRWSWWRKSQRRQRERLWKRKRKKKRMQRHAETSWWLQI